MPLLYRLGFASIAFVLWGTWAYLANEDFSERKGLISALIQGVGSFVITLFILSLIIYFRSIFWTGFCRDYLSGMVAVGITGTGLVLIHIFAGTPALLKTVSAPLCVALLFALYSCHKLKISEERT